MTQRVHLVFSSSVLVRKPNVTAMVPSVHLENGFISACQNGLQFGEM